MDFLEKVDRLRQRANVTYEEAKQALEQTGGDLLEAVILLEKQGKVDPPPPTRPAPSAGEGGQQHTYQQGQSGRATFGEVCGRFVRFLGRLVRRGNVNFLEVHHKGEEMISLPVTVFVLLLIFAFWVVVPLMIVSLFFGWKYSLRGPDLGRQSVNDALSRATDKAESVKNEFCQKDDGPSGPANPGDSDHHPEQ